MDKQIHKYNVLYANVWSIASYLTRKFQYLYVDYPSSLLSFDFLKKYKL